MSELKPDREEPSQLCYSGHGGFTEMCSGSEAGPYLRLIDSRITQLKDQGPSRTCNESKEEEEDTGILLRVGAQSEVLVDQHADPDSPG